MWPLAIVVTIVALCGALLTAGEPAQEAGFQAQDVQAALNMAWYRSAVVARARANPSFTGSIADSDLAMPTWYQRNPAWRNTVLADGTVVVYAQGSLPASLVTRISDLAQGSVLAGSAQRRPDGTTVLVSPRRGDTGIVLPTLPPGTPVWLARAQ